MKDVKFKEVVKATELPAETTEDILEKYKVIHKEQNMKDVKFKEVVKATELPAETTEDILKKYKVIHKEQNEEVYKLRQQIKLKNSIIKQYEKFLSGKEL